MVHLVRRHPRALIFRHKTIARRHDLDAVGRSESARDPLHFLGLDIDAIQRTAMGGVRPVEADDVALDTLLHNGVAEINRCRERAVEPSILLFEPEGKVVVVVADPRLRPLFVRLEGAVVVEVAQAVDAGAVRNIDVAVVHRDAARIVVTAGKLLELDRLWRCANDIRQDVERAVGVLAQDAVVRWLEVAYDQPTVGQKRHAANLWLESLWAQRLDFKRRMHDLDRHAIARTHVLAAVLVDLLARCSHAGHARLGAQRRLRHKLESPRARRTPVENERGTAFVLEEVDAKGVQSRAELDRAGLGRRRMMTIVLDHLLRIDLEPASIVAAEFELVLAGHVDLQKADRLNRHLIQRHISAAERGRVLEVDLVLQAIGVGRLVLNNARNMVDRAPDVVDAQRVALLKIHGRRDQRDDGNEQHGDEHQPMLTPPRTAPVHAHRLPRKFRRAFRPSSPSTRACQRSATRSRTRCRTN